MNDVRCMMNDVRCMMNDVRCIIYDVKYMIYDVWCMMMSQNTINDLRFGVWVFSFQILWASQPTPSFPGGPLSTIGRVVRAADGTPDVPPKRPGPGR